MKKGFIEKFIVQDKEDGDDILHNELFNVNMRLFNTNKKHNKLILNIVNYMEKIAKKKFKDYTSAKGISGANVGVPFNIIGVKNKKNKWDFFINPTYLKKSPIKKTVKSNCGSLCLEKPIETDRCVWIKIEYYDLKGQKKIEYFSGPYGNTIQHEIDHNKGILITDGIKEDIVEKNIWKIWKKWKIWEGKTLY